MKSLRLFVLLLALALLLTVFLLPLAAGLKLFVLAVLAFSAVFVFVEANGMGKTFTALILAALVFYLGVCFHRGLLLLEGANAPALILGLSMLVLPCLGAWALIREVLFGSRVQQLAHQLRLQGQLPEDNLRRSPSGRVDREAADAEFQKFRSLLEADPQNWVHWFNIASLYDVAGDRKRARKAMRTAIALWQGKTEVDLEI
ncbi:MAG: tetratricopeptide repeat protein [Rothia sp. (in: high G+C Gram-positive bacteria)]|nr:tetratricopeptide repeat protein [Rothia sp. (in: high G+C Gram-positive bacteria)]